MRLKRILLIVVILAAAFYFGTTVGFFGGRGASSLLSRIKGSSHSPLHLTIANAEPALTPQEENNIAVYKRVLPSVVNITSSELAFNFFYGVVPQQGQGSGFVLTSDGRIITNYHVIANAQHIEVSVAGNRKYQAKVILQDRGHDIALLQIQATDLKPVVLASSRNLLVGENVYAIGNPFGLSGTMTNGMISSIRSVREPGGTLIENAIQVDAPINPGNSGGPLLNSGGQVIGMNTLIASGGAAQSAGIGFAIPVDTIKAILSDFNKYGRVRRPTLGVVGLPIGPDLASQMGLPSVYGVLIQQVVPGGAAAAAGLRGGTHKAYLGNVPIFLGGDLIVAIGSQQITSGQNISEIMDQHQVGDRVTVTYYRGKQKRTVTVTLGEAGQVSV